MPSTRLAPNTNLRAAAVYLLSFAIVFGYVNTFVLWRAFGNTFGTGLRDALPWIMVGAIALGLVVFLLWKRSGARISWRWLAVAVLAAVIGLSITDPAFPGKRIHVPQYFLLAIIVWFALPARLRTPMTPVFVLVAVVLYGIHDEFLQGLHPRRTFGLRDMRYLRAACVFSAIRRAGTRDSAGDNVPGGPGRSCFLRFGRPTVCLGRHGLSQ